MPGGDTMISKEDIAYAQSLCAAFEPLYRGPNPLTSGLGYEDEAERHAAVKEAWTAWSGFSRNYFMAMLHTLAGFKPLVIESSINQSCSQAEAVGGRAALDVFWRRGLAMRGTLERRGGVSLTPIQHSILADDDVNSEVFKGVEARMEASIMATLRGRRGFLRQIEPDADHQTGLQEDITYFFGKGRPTPLPRNKRNENFDMLLF